MKRILLTGGNGFIGKNIKESYLKEKYEIVAPSSSELNLVNSVSVKNFFENEEYFDVVIHCATKPSHRNAKDFNNILYSNLMMFQNLEQYKASKFEKFINLGSGAIYDTSKDIIEEKEENRFDSIGQKEHDFCKYIVSKQILNLDNFVDFNIFGIFGKYEDYEIRFISNAICKSIYNLPITIKQDRIFSYLDVSDLMPILEHFIENDFKQKSYNIVPDRKIKLSEIANIVKEVTKNKNEIIISKDGLGFEYTGDNTLLKKEIPNIQFTNIEKSISLLYNYYLKNIKNINRNLLLKDK